MCSKCVKLLVVPSVKFFGLKCIEALKIPPNYYYYNYTAIILFLNTWFILKSYNFSVPEWKIQ